MIAKIIHPKEHGNQSYKMPAKFSLVMIYDNICWSWPALSQAV